MDEDEQNPWNFTGFRLSVGSNGVFRQDQNKYLKKLEHLSLDETFSEFRSMRMRLTGLEHNRTYLLFEISQLAAQVTEYKYMPYKRRSIKKIKNPVKYEINNRVTLKVSKMEERPERVSSGFSDASFGDNEELTTQLG